MGSRPAPPLIEELPLNRRPGAPPEATSGQADPPIAAQLGLFAADSGKAAIPTARPVVVITRGRVEYAARCPQCQAWHHHVSLGGKRAPCGAVYLLQPRRGRAA